MKKYTQRGFRNYVEGNRSGDTGGEGMIWYITNSYHIAGQRFPGSFEVNGLLPIEVKLEQAPAQALELLWEAAKGNTNIDDFGPLLEAYRIVKKAIGGDE